MTDARDRFIRLATAATDAAAEAARCPAGPGERHTGTCWGTALEAATQRTHVEAFCDAVDTENTDHRRYLPLAYQEATVLDGSHGVLVIATSVYRMLRIEAEARVGDDVTVTHGAELLLDERDLRNDTAWTGSTYGV